MRYIFSMICFISLSVLGNSISISLKNAPTAEIISYLAEENDKNIVLVDDIQPTKSLRIENSSFDEIIHSLANIHQLNVKQDNHIYYIREKTETPIKTQALNQSTLPKPAKLITKTVKLHYSKASEVIESLTKGQGNLLSENGYLHFDDRSNRLIIKDNPQSVNYFLELIKKIDQPTEQIAIEARIVTISSEHLKALGVRWGVFSPSADYHKFSGSLEAKGANLPQLNVNFPVINGASAALQIASINSRVLDLELTALERENSVEIIASPRLLTTDKKSASIKQGAEIPYAIYDRKADMKNIQFKEAVLGLEVVPHISKDHQILLDLVVTQNAPHDRSGASELIAIDKQELKTQVFAKHGETIVLGGIFQHLTAKGEDKVPLLGSIPVLKHLFSQSRDKISKRELVIFVTPYIIRQPPVVATKIDKKSKQK
ncbi:secretin [[Actinobacillus] muris]|uniref:Secretin n=1 Tax=Muribacter muris TaxID=67855 RepID=A0A0J5S6C2_9PAST|nr:type IV pilus secretin PilQ [Muribacter muris]KMK52412.1 secretin [[Actinobacillus] muris] [Muribacter muris]